jgi:hypothetical protein
MAVSYVWLLTALDISRCLQRPLSYNRLLNGVKVVALVTLSVVLLTFFHRFLRYRGGSLRVVSREVLVVTLSFFVFENLVFLLSGLGIALNDFIDTLYWFLENRILQVAML